MEKPYRIVLDVGKAVEQYYADFPDPNEAKMCNTAEFELETMFMEITDANKAVSNLYKDFNRVIQCNRINGDAGEIRWACSVLNLGENVFKALQDSQLYDEQGQLIGRFEYLLESKFLCLYVDEDEEPINQ